MVTNGLIKTEDLVFSYEELARRMGVPRGFMDDDEEVSAAIETVRKSIEAKYSYGISPAEVKEETNEIITDFGIFTSSALCRNLAGSSEMIVFGVTLGHSADRTLRKLAAESPLAHFFADAAASSYAEAAADFMTEKFREIYGKEHLKNRFSPGYGDFDIRYQENVIKKIEGTKNLGITLTDSFLMIPQKSITAFHGVIK